MTIFVKPSAKIELAHRALYSAYGLNSGLLAFASAKGNVTVVGLEHTVQTTFQRPYKIKGIAVHPTLPLLGIVEGEENHLVIVDIDGIVIHQSPPAETDEPLDYDFDGSGSCHFESDGLHLWYARTGLNDDIELQWLDPKTWRVVYQLAIDDPYGTSHISLHSTSTPGQIALWLAAGQDGQQVYWLSIGHEGIVCKIEPLLEDTMPPVFSPSGDEFLAIDDEVINKYQFPDVRLAGTYKWAEDGGEEAGYVLSYINEAEALTNSFKGRLYLLDLATMSLSDEVSLEGHEPQPRPVYYPTLSDDGRKCTNVSGMEKFGDTLIFTFCRHQGENISDWQDTLLFAPLTAFRAEEQALEVPVYC